jgi:hypothetical protein
MTIGGMNLIAVKCQLAVDDQRIAELDNSSTCRKQIRSVD